MFKELAPLLQQRSVIIVVNPIDQDKLTIAVLPKKLNDSENAALSTPVSVTGTPEELDEQLPSTLTQFVGAHIELKNTLELAKEEMARAAKAAKQDNKAKTVAKTEPTATTRTTEKKPASVPAKPAEPKAPPVPTTANLFDFGSAPSPAPQPPAPSAPVPVEDSPDDSEEEEEILAEISEGDEDNEELDPAA